MNLGQNPKDIVTNVIALVLTVLGAGQTALEAMKDTKIDYMQLALVMAAALIAFLSGKHPSLQGQPSPVAILDTTGPLPDAPIKEAEPVVAKEEPKIDAVVTKVEAPVKEEPAKDESVGLSPAVIQAIGLAVNQAIVAQKGPAKI